MKKSFLLIVCVLLFGVSCKQSAELTEEQKTAIQAEVENQFDSCNAAAVDLNIDAFSEYYSEDEFISVYCWDETYTSLNTWIDSVAHAWSRLESRSAQFLEKKVTLLSPDLGLVTSVLDVDNLTKSGEKIKVKVLITLIWKKEQTGWKIIHYHESGKEISEE